ncbi:MAG: glycosyltransferase family 2 protein [Myxococcota bacterium]
MSAQPEISVVLPIYNEEGTLGACLGEVLEQLEKLRVRFEILCVNDGSSDGSEKLIERESQRDSRIVPVHLSRNFGKEGALAAGLQAAGGRAVLLMDADLQHPPNLIPLMLERWRGGYEVVEAIKEDRGREGIADRLLARGFYLLMGRAVGENLRDSSDFKLLDRQVVDVLLEFPERCRFLRGLVAWVGFRVARIPFRVQERRAGKSKWSRRALLRYSVQNLVAFSSAPLRVVAWTGFSTVLAAVLLAIGQFYYYFSGRSVSGFTTVILVMLFLSGLILTSLGVISLYVANMYDEQKARPLFVVRRGGQLGSSAQAGPPSPVSEPGSSS